MTIHSASPPGATDERTSSVETTAPAQTSPQFEPKPLPPPTRVAQASTTNRAKSLRGALRGAVPATLLGLAALAFWQLLVQANVVPTILLPGPADVLRYFWSSLTDPASGLLSAIFITLVESLLGCVLGAMVAIPLGYGIVRSRIIAGAFQPYVAASQALPAVAIAPLLALLLPYGLTPIVVLCALIVFFPMVITTILGMRLLDKDILDAARVDGANRWALLRSIELPLALPAILAGVRAGLTLSITGAVVGEFVIGGNGLGELLVIQRENLDSAGVFATLLTLALLAMLLYGAIRLIERRFSFTEASALS